MRWRAPSPSLPNSRRFPRFFVSNVAVTRMVTGGVEKQKCCAIVFYSKRSFPCFSLYADGCLFAAPIPASARPASLLHPSTGGWPTRGRGGQTAHAAESWCSLGSTASPMAVPGRPDRTTSTRSILAAGPCATRGRRNPGATLRRSSSRAHRRRLAAGSVPAVAGVRLLGSRSGYARVGSTAHGGRGACSSNSSRPRLPCTTQRHTADCWPLSDRYARLSSASAQRSIAVAIGIQYGWFVCAVADRQAPTACPNYHKHTIRSHCGHA